MGFWELPGKGLRARDPAVEEDRMDPAVERLGLDVDGNGQVVARGEDLGPRPGGRDQPVRVGGRRLGGVITPLEGLDRVLGGGHRRGGREPLVLVLEALDAPQEVALGHGLPILGRELRPLDREAEQVGAGERARLQVPGERDDVVAGDGPNREVGAGVLVSHDAPSPGKDMVGGHGTVASEAMAKACGDQWKGCAY